MTTILVSSRDKSDVGHLTINSEDFDRIRRLIYDRFGIHLADNKQMLVQGRLNKVLREKGYESFREYVDDIEHSASSENLLVLVDRISTNHSFFFREADHFEYLTSAVLPSLLKQGVAPDELRIWSAGAAEGQEPYTLAMVLHNFFGGSPFKTSPGILATDISVTALRNATHAVYPASVIASVPERYRKYFRRVEERNVQITEEIRKDIVFKRLNLNQPRFPFKKRFHIIFCRNVMIYFDQPTKTSLVERMAGCTHKGGYLIIGHSESLGRDVKNYRYLRPTVYQRWE